MIRKHTLLYKLILLCIVTLSFSVGIVSADDWTIEGDKVYVDDNKVYLSASPHTIDESGWVYFDINSKVYSGEVDLYFGFNSGGMKPTRAYVNINNNWVEFASYFNKVNYEYDGFDIWYYSKNLPVQAGNTYKIAVWMEQPNTISFGKYGFAIKPSFQTLNEAIYDGNFYYLDPWWSSDFNSLSTVTLNASVPEDNFQVHLTSDNFNIPLKMWMNMDQNGNDTRFLHTDNTTVFPIWIEHITAADDYSIWVNVTDDTTGSTLLWYYGNETVDSVSDGDSTFIFYDDAENGTFNDKWTDVVSSGGSYSTDDKWTGSKCIKTYGDQAVIAASNINITSGVFEAYVKSQSQYNMFTFYSSTTADTYYGYRPGYANEQVIKSVDGSHTTIANDANTESHNTWNLYKTTINSTGDINIYYNDVLDFSVTDTTISSGSIGARASASTYIYMDTVRIRNYNYVNPIISNITLSVFTNAPPTAPEVVYPLSESFVTSAGAVMLNVSSTDIDDDVISYYFYGDTVNGSTFLGINETDNVTSYNWGISTYDVYYWKAIAYDGFNYSEESDIFNFTFLPEPNLTTPLNSSTLYTTYPPLTVDVSFNWQDVDAPQYKLMVAEDENFNVLSVNTHLDTNNSIQTLIVNKQYWWKVYSYDVSVYSDSSDVYSFNLTGNSSLTGPSIEGVVYQSNGELSAISGAEVTIWNTTWSSSMITGSNGYYVFEDLNSGTVYNLQAKSDRYWDSSISLVNATSDPVTNNFYLIDDLTDTEWWHYVEFTVQNVWGVTYPDVATNVYIGNSPTISDSGNTESDGTISFHMDQNVQYRITFINSTLGINEDIKLYPVATSYKVYIDSYSFDIPTVVTDDIQAYIVSSRINATYGYINFTWSDTSDLTTSIDYSISDVDGNVLYSTSTSSSDLFDSQVVAATDDRYIVRYIGVHPTHGTIDKTETIVFHGGRRVDLGWPSDWQYAVTALAFLIFFGALFGAKTAQYGGVTVVMLAWFFKWIGWLDNSNTSTLLLILATVIAFGWVLRKSEEVKT